MREEKRRKQMESIAEDLFNNQKVYLVGLHGTPHNLCVCVF
jgi:hypothetical protein